MSEAQGCDYYDQIYRTSTAYKQSHREAAGASLWQFVAKHIKPEDHILDLGCGPGHLAATLIDAGLDPAHYVGADFSAVAIRQAAVRVPGATFIQVQIPGHLVQLLTDYSPTVITFCEVLEHLGDDEDLMAIQLLPACQRVIGTVPNFDDSLWALVSTHGLVSTPETCDSLSSLWVLRAPRLTHIASHVRTFNGPDAVVARYGKLLNIEKLDWITENHLGFVARRRC